MQTNSASCFFQQIEAWTVAAGPSLEEMEAHDLLALLASLGAQQQAVLSAIAVKQQPFQKAAAIRQPTPGALQPILSSLAPKGQGVDISVAAGDSAAQAQLHRSNWKICKLSSCVVRIICLVPSRFVLTIAVSFGRAFEFQGMVHH